MIISVKDGRIPSLQTLKDAESWNKDGAGIAWLKNGTVHFKKGLDLKAEEIHAILKRERPKTAIIHFRIKSSGEVISELTHPFIVSKDSELKLSGTAESVFFHNGTIYDWSDDFKQAVLSGRVDVPDGALNDSRAMAIFAAVYGKNFLKLYGTQKFAILDKNGITKFGSWVKVGKHECSNDNFVKKETETHLKNNPWSNWCNKHYLYNCTQCQKTALPAPIADKAELVINDDYYLEREALEEKYRQTNDPKEAKLILDKLDELDDKYDREYNFYWPKNGLFDYA